MPNRKATLEFIKSATAYKRGVGKKYLTFGQMIKPYSVVSDMVKMYKTNAERFTEYPAVLTTAWEESDGTRAQFLANYCLTTQKITIDLRNTNGADLIDENGNVIKVLDSAICELEILANSVSMIVFK